MTDDTPRTPDKGDDRQRGDLPGSVPPNPSEDRYADGAGHPSDRGQW